MDHLENFEAYDQLLIDPFARRGWQVDMVSWRTPEPDWDRYEAVVIRSPWDYHQNITRFLKVLETIDASSALLENPLPMIRWNISKTYLRELEEKGVLIVPTLWGETLQENDLNDAFDALNTSGIVIKPPVSAGAEDTFWLTSGTKPAVIRSAEKTFSDRPYMIQPFMDNIVKEGEFSLFYFAGHYSHTILKTPKERDFRVQEEHGGRLKKVEPESKLRVRAEQTMNQLQTKPLYARVDLVRTTNNDFALMELELIEPSLYFNMDPQSPERFALIFDEWMSKRYAPS